MRPSKAAGNSRRLLYISTVLLCVSASINARYINEQDFDLDVAAAEPRPIIIETGPPAAEATAEALPLVYNVDSSTGPLSVASEKVEKVLLPALSFSYNQQPVAEDGEAAESKLVDQKPAAVDYYKYVESQDKKEGAGKAEESGKEEATHVEVDAGGESAESKQHGHKHDDKGGGDANGEFEKGGGKEFHAHHAGEHGEKGDKGYKGHHHHEKGQKGHHDKEDHVKHYNEHGGDKKGHHHEDGYHGEHQKSHGGKKGAKYAEEGEHSKGHSTKGSHSIHKKDEYDKRTEFFEEDNEGGESEKQGGFSHKDEYHKGGHHKGGHKKGGHHEEHHGKEGESSKGGHFKDEEGHFKKAGHDHHHDHDTKYGKKEGESRGKQWGYSEGTGGGGHDGGGHGHGAHSHPSVVVQAPPRKQNVAETARITNYEIPPITSVNAFRHPLIGESPRIGKRISIDDGVGGYSDLVGAIAKKGTKRKPTPTDDFLADNPFSSSNDKETSFVFDPIKFDILPSTTASSIELLIRQEIQRNKPKPPAPVKLAPVSTVAPEPNPKPAESQKVTKKRRLKKRKIQKGTKAQASSTSSKVAPDCEGHKKEGQVPEETSHSFVIVAADDSQ